MCHIIIIVVKYYSGFWPNQIQPYFGTTKTCEFFFALRCVVFVYSLKRVVPRNNKKIRLVLD